MKAYLNTTSLSSPYIFTAEDDDPFDFNIPSLSLEPKDEYSFTLFEPPSPLEDYTINHRSPPRILSSCDYEISLEYQTTPLTKPPVCPEPNPPQPSSDGLSSLSIDDQNPLERSSYQYFSLDTFCTNEEPDSTDRLIIPPAVFEHIHISVSPDDAVTTHAAAIADFANDLREGTLALRSQSAQTMCEQDKEVWRSVTIKDITSPDSPWTEEELLFYDGYVAKQLSPTTTNSLKCPLCRHIGSVFFQTISFNTNK